MPDIEVKATADVKGGIDGLKQLQGELAKTAVTAVKTDSAIDKAGKTLGTSLKAGANQATGALTNLGRVIQDAPFGIIGITNNINPLLESFQRLKVETGTTGGALKALAGSLIGGGGLGLAVSVVTSLLTVFAMNTRSTGDAAEDAGKKVKTYADFLHEAASSVAQEQTDVLGLIGVLKNETETRERKLAAIKELQKIQPEIFAGLKLEKDAVIGLDAAYTAYVANLKNVIQAKILQAQLEPLLTREMELQKIILNAQANSTKNLANEARNAARGEGELTKQLAKQQDILKGLTLTGASLELTPLKAQIDDITKQLFALSKTIILPVKEVKLKPENVTIDTDHITNFLGEEEMEGLLKNQKPLTFKPKVIVEPDVEVPAGTSDEMLESFLKQIKLDEFNAAVGAAVAQTANNMAATTLDTFAEAIGTAIGKGGKVLPNLFEGLMKNLGGQIKDLGKFMVKIGIEYLALQKALENLKSKPGLIIAAGIALEILGSALQAKAQKKYDQGFATGVRNFSGGSAIVGERGPERVFLPAGSSVQPNNELNAFGGNSNGYIAETRISATELVILVRRGEASMGRNN